MKDNHTPGPWKIDAGPRHYSITTKTGSICDMRLPKEWGVPIKEVDANAKIIVASPDLLEALEKIANHQKFICMDTPLIDAIGLMQKTIREMMDIAGAAITKAKGEI